MKANRNGTQWTTLVTLCVASLTLATGAFAEPTRIGTVLGVPLSDLENFRRANTVSGSETTGQRVPANDVTILHISSAATAPINGAIATVSVTQKGSGLKAWRVYFPPAIDGGIAPIYQYINAHDYFSNARLVNDGSVAAVQVDVRQEHTGNGLLENTRFMLVPAESYYRLGAGFEIVHTQRMSVGLRTVLVHLVAIGRDRAAEFKVPSDLAGMIQALNSNLFLTGTPVKEETAVSIR